MEPEHGAEDDGRDRLGVHAAWEAVLLIGVGVAAALVWSRSPAALSGQQLRDQLVSAAAAVLLASAFAASLRAAAPNLAAGGTAVATAVLVAWLHGVENLTLAAACGIAAGAAVVLGLLLGLVTTGLRAPGWAVTIAAAALLGAAVLDLSHGAPLPLTDGPDLHRWAWALFGGGSLLSIAGGGLALSPNTRAALSRNRADRDPAAGRGGPAVLAVTAALAASSLLAAGAGLVMLFQQHAAVPTDGLTTTFGLAAIAAALLGGVSVHGRRGGVFGTALAATMLQLVLVWLRLGQIAAWVQFAVIGGAALLGLGVSRVIEWLSPPRPDELLTAAQAEEAYPSRYAALYGGDQNATGVLYQAEQRPPGGQYEGDPYPTEQQQQYPTEQQQQYPTEQY